MNQEPKQNRGKLREAPSTIGELAVFDPRLAYTLASCADGDCDTSRVYLPTDSEWATGGWEIINLKGTFTSGAAGTSVQAQMFGIVAADLWVRRVTYTVKLPNVAGNLLSPQYAYYNRLNPNIDFTLLINSYCRYTISPELTPLENIETVFECVCPAGIVLGATSNMSASLQLTRTYSDGTNGSIAEVPLSVVISFHATRLPNKVYNTVDDARAMKYLRDRGLAQ